MLMRRNRFPTLFNDRERSDMKFSEMLDEMMESAFSTGRGTFIPEMNIYETEDNFEITLALPGMRKEDIELSLEGTTLTISGERELNEDEDKKYHRIESRFGSFERTLPLPNTIDEENISATYENGVLTITVPKLEKETGKQIEVS